MEFKKKAPACEETCGNRIYGNCNDEPTSRCVCKSGYVLKGIKCVTKVDCGVCKDENGDIRDVGLPSTVKQ